MYECPGDCSDDYLRKNLPKMNPKAKNFKGNVKVYNTTRTAPKPSLPDNVIVVDFSKGRNK